MRSTTQSSFALFCCIATAVLAQTPAATAPPTMAEIQAAYDAKQYADVVKKVPAALALKGNAAIGMDREKLYVIRGESQLHLKQFAPAADAFTAAVKEKPDSKNATLYTATALLIRRSPGGKYPPKQPTTQTAAPGAKPEPIDIVEADSRKLAFAALYNDEAKLAVPKIEAAAKQRALPPLMAGIKQATDLRTLELAATGKDVASQKLLTSLGDRSTELMTAALKIRSLDVDAIYKSANSTTSATVGGSTVQIKAGLTSTDVNNLKEVVDFCKQVAEACDELAASMPAGVSAAGRGSTPSNGRAGAAPADVFGPVKNDAVALNNHAIDVLQADYGNGQQMQTEQRLQQNPYQTNQPTPRGVGTGTRSGTGTGRGTGR